MLYSFHAPEEKVIFMIFFALNCQVLTTGNLFIDLIHGMNKNTFFHIFLNFCLIFYEKIYFLASGNGFRLTNSKE